MKRKKGADAPKIKHFQTVMLVSDMDALKEATGEHFAEDALSKAALHYISCVNKGV